MSGTHAYPAACAALLLALAAACGGDGEPRASAGCTPDAAPTYTFVFWDGSASTAADRTSDRDFSESLRGLLGDAVRCPGDRMQAFLVHARTRGKAYRVDIRHELELPETRGSRNQVARDSLRYIASLRQLRRRGWRRLTALIDSTSLPPRLTRSTDLLGTLEVVSEELADAPEDARAHVYYYSDMFESMDRSGRRDFDRSPPRNRAQAEEWAHADAEMVRRQMNVRPDRFAGVDVHVRLARYGNRSAVSAVKFYWLTVLEELGFAPERVHYN